MEEFMQQRENDSIKQEKFINIRKLAALDIVFHGARLILAEFIVAVVFCGFFGAFTFFAFFRNPDHSLFEVSIGFVLSWIAINYVPLLLYTISIVKRKSAELEVAFELEHKDFYARKYTLQSLLLVLPLVVPILAISQELQKRSRR
jgi:hypothetical protein